MDKSPKRPRVRVADILFLAGLASASSLSLSSFQFIASNGIPLGCIIAYNTRLDGCTTSDFGERNKCSAACVASIERVTTIISSACSSVEVAQGSLLDLALSGMLLQVLCPNDDDGTATKSSSSARVTTTTLRFTTNPGSSISTSRLSSSSSSTPSNPAQSATIVAPTITTTSPANIGGTNGGGILTTSASTPTSSSSSTTKSTQQTQDFPGGVGGGSPFDPVQLSSADTARAGAAGSMGLAKSIAVSLGVVAALMFTL